MVQHLLPHALFAPAAEASLDRTPGAVALGNIPPGSSGAQAPEQPIEDHAMIAPGTARFVGPALRWQKSFEDFILLIR